MSLEMQFKLNKASLKAFFEHFSFLMTDFFFLIETEIYGFAFKLPINFSSFIAF